MGDAAIGERPCELAEKRLGAISAGCVEKKSKKNYSLHLNVHLGGLEKWLEKARKGSVTVFKDGDKDARPPDEIEELQIHGQHLDENEFIVEEIGGKHKSARL